MHIFAAIDVGSNAIRMSVARLDADGKLEILDNTRVAVRLGGDAFTLGEISEPTLEAATDALLRFRRIADDFAVTDARAVATSALREARNSDDLIERVARIAQWSVEVIGGEEEARLIQLAVARAVDLKGKRSMLVDIGGGSAEVTLCDGEDIVCTETYDLGAVRLLKQFGEAALGSPAFNLLVGERTEAVRRRIAQEIGDKPVELCVGTGGNLEELGELRKRLYKRDSDRLVTVGELEGLVETLVAMTVPERIDRFKLRPDRADVIVPAAVVMLGIARIAGVDEIRLPGVGLKDGILWDLASQAAPRAPRREQVWSSALRLAARYEADDAHGAVVCDLACQLFDQTAALHGLGGDERLLLEVAGLLHDVGHYINSRDHDRHGHYILRNSFIFGLTRRQQAVVAVTVRYHRKSTPSPDHEHFRALPDADRQLVRQLAALLRLADGIDTGHVGRVRRVTLEEAGGSWRLALHGEGDLTLEKWNLGKRRTLFQDVFGVDLQIA